MKCWKIVSRLMKKILFVSLEKCNLLLFYLLFFQIFRNHSIDGSALLQLTENHMTRILGLKLGPAIKLRICIRDLVQKMNSANPSAKTPPTTSQ